MFLKLIICYKEYSKDKENNKDFFLDKVISINNQINENINSISNNNSNNNVKLDMIKKINVLKENVKQIENESKSKINLMKNNSIIVLNILKSIQQ